MDSIRLEPSSVIFPPTYISATSKFAIKIINETGQAIHYEWRKYSSEEEENQVLGQLDSSDPLKRASIHTSLFYNSEIFGFDPPNHEIWSKRYEQAIASFTPELATNYTETSYLYIIETKQRIPFTLHGMGLAPEAHFTITSINVGHISLETILEYQVVLENVGQVGVDFSLQPKKLEGLIVEFTPEKGHIPIGNSQKINIKFIANIVGSFSEIFQFNVRGCTHGHPTITLYGRVIGPTFAISAKSLVFGDVSYGFLYEKVFEIENKSDIPFDYAISLSHDTSYSRREFSVVPSSGTVNKFVKQQIKIEFIPVSVQEYHLELYIDIPKFGSHIVTIPISAQCILPIVSVMNTKIDLGSLYIGYEYSNKIELKDESELPAKFEFIYATDSSQLQATVNVARSNGIIPANSITEVPFTIIPQQLGPLMLTHYVKIIGNDRPPIPITIMAICTGPTIRLSKPSIEFGAVPVLKDTFQTFHLYNDSRIDAVFHAKIETKEEIFRIEPQEGLIFPGGETSLSITAFLDDNTTFNSNLLLSFENLNVISVPISAIGTGVPLVPSVSMSSIDLGCVFTEQPLSQEFTLENRGRRTQDVRWSSQKPKFSIQEEPFFSFKITPEQTMIAPGSLESFQITFQCQKPTSFSLMLQCFATVSKQRIEVFSPIIKGVFIRPQLSFSKQVLEFRHVHDPFKEEELSQTLSSPKDTSPSPSVQLLEMIHQPLEVINMSKLALQMVADIPEPFSLSLNSFSLEPMEKKTIIVTFDPAFKSDFSCEIIQKKIIFSFIGHPQKHSVGLKGVLVFPNINFSPSTNLNFGNLLTNTEQTKDIVLENPTELPIDFYWEVLNENGGISISQVFDIYPFRGHIEPYEKDEVHISFFAQKDDLGRSAQYKGRAICHVIGGPDYVISLKGGSANIMYRIEPTQINYGQKSYLDQLDSTITLTNLSDVSILYSVKIPKGNKFTSFSVQPKDGTISVGGNVNLSLHLVPGLPIEYRESFFIQIGHFDEVRIDLCVDCFLPQLNICLPRSEQDPVITTYNQKISRSQIENEEEEELIEPSSVVLSEIERQILINKLSSKPAQHAFELSPHRRRSKKEDNQYEGLIASKYAISMGKIVFGKIETKSFSFRSITPFPISFDIVTDNLIGSGFSIDPKSFKDIPPNTDISVAITFDTKNKTTDFLGDVEYEVPIITSQDFAYIVVLSANLSMPSLTFSQKHFDFGMTIVGQAYIITLQLQNMNSVPVEFHFGDAQFINVLQRSMSQSNISNQVFSATPSSGILPSASFLNVELAFAPKQEKSYSMQFPIEVKHNTHTSFITLKGIGVQLRVTFDPPELLMPPILPFSDPSLFEVRMMNPASYPIEVMAQQFDLQLFLEQQMAKQSNPQGEQEKEAQPITEDSDNSVAFSHASPNSISKFSLCVIVHGTSGSGRTTISQTISEYLGGVPIICLKSLWNDCINSTQAIVDCTTRFSEEIRKPNYLNGFVIDGLDAFPEHPETESFLVHCLKQKNSQEEVVKNPFLSFPHTHLTAFEQSVSIILQSLDGHYVFLVAIRATEELLMEREAAKKSLETKKRRIERNQEKEHLFKMTEEQYSQLSPEDQQNVDQKRKSLRKRIFRALTESEETKEIVDTKSSRSGKSHKKKTSHSSKESEKDKKSSNDAKSSAKHTHSSSSKATEEANKKPKRKANSLPNDPIPLSIVNFSYTLGSICQLLREGNEKFTVVDPVSILKESAKASPRDNEDQKSSDPQSWAPVNSDLSPRSNSKPTLQLVQEPIIMTQTNLNTMLIDANNHINETNQAVLSFIPQLNYLKEKSFTRLIPQPKIVLPDPMLLHKATLLPMPQHFSILIEENVEDLVNHIVMRPDSTKSGRKSRNKKDREPTPLPIDDLDLSKRTPRWKIEPNTFKVLTIKFEATMIGEYRDYLSFCLLNGKSDLFKLKVSGVCSYPNIDRTLKSIFPKRVAKLDSKTEFSYAIDTNEFHFGSLLIAKEKSGKNSQSQYRQAIKLYNPTPFNVELFSNLYDNSPKAVWAIETPNIVIRPGETTEFCFGVHPLVPDLFKTTLTMFIKDHPEPFSFNIVAEGCAPSIDLSSTNLDFDRLLLNQQKTMKIDIRNSGKLPAFWRLKNLQTIGPNFIFNSTEGMLNPKTSFNLSVLYSSNKPLAIKKPILFEVLDKDQARVFHSKQLMVSAESFDVSFDFQYPKGLDHLNFGSLKVSQSRTIICTLRNKGKYPSAFKFIIENQKIAQLFTISPNEGQLVPNDKPLNISISFMAPKLVSFDNSKGIVLKILDVLTNTTTSTYATPFSAVTLYSSFNIDPKLGIDFGAIPISTSVSKTMTIVNSGAFAFEFDISPKPEAEINDPKLNDPKKKKNTPRAQTANKAKPRKGNEKSISIGGFTICPCVGTIPPGGSSSIDIEFITSNEGLSDSTALITITDMNPAQFPSPISFRLKAESFIPGIVTSDFPVIFPGTHLCLRYDLGRTTQISFLEDEQILHYTPLILQQRSTVPIVLLNTLPIPCSVDLVVKSNNKTKQTPATFPFEISDKLVSIEPNSSKTVTLSFIPVTCDSFNGVFEANVKGGINPLTKTLKFGIEGVGTLPSINLITSLEKPSKSGFYTVNLGRTLVGFSKEKAIALSNDGMIATKVNLVAKPTLDFELLSFEPSQDLIIEPGHRLNLQILYSPQKVRKGQFDIMVNIVDNPKANLAFSFIGEGFSEDIIFEGLPDDDNDLIFKDNVVGRQQQNSFIMRNISQSDIRFVWNNHTDFSFSPRVGHLRVGSSKSIIVSFFSDKPIRHNALKINCQWQKIELDNPNCQDWDDTQKVVKYIPKVVNLPPETPSPPSEMKKLSKKLGSSRKSAIGTPNKADAPIKVPIIEPEMVRVTEIRQEPTYQASQGKFKDLMIRVFAVSDLIKYSIDTTEISFSPTMMYQKRITECKITNTCQIRFDYVWSVKNFHALRTEYALVRKPPFSIEPSTGFIESGQSTTFKVIFEPEEVDDFTATLVCEIPFLSQIDPPSIPVSGFSRRPLCHFNLEMSDYITASRRHPDFTDPLPDNVRVIELFSSAVGKVATKKFEIINPTSSSYEINWHRVSTSEMSQCVKCDTPSALISSGKRYIVAFSYLPTSVRTIESLWEFQIPEHGIRVSLLVVGRIMPK